MKLDSFSAARVDILVKLLFGDNTTAIRRNGKCVIRSFAGLSYEDLGVGATWTQAMLKTYSSLGVVR